MSSRENSQVINNHVIIRSLTFKLAQMSVTILAIVIVGAVFAIFLGIYIIYR